MIKTQNIKLVKLRDIQEHLQRKECEQHNIPFVGLSTSYDIPDKDESIHQEIHDLLMNHRYGNQTFTNDSIFRYSFASLNGEPLSALEQSIYDLCSEAIEDEELFIEVSW